MTALQPLKSLLPDTAPAERLAAFVVGVQVPDEVLALAARVIVDTLAVTVAGGAEEPVRRLAASLEPWPGAVPSFWGPEAFRGDDAALLTGMASHVLDYDDVSMLSVCHPTAPVLSALLPLLDKRTVTGKELLGAVAVGTEVLIRLGQSMGFRHYALGFHATATLGAIGAAAGVARLLRLDADSTRRALAIAASMACGLRKNFGSMVKSLHVGLAASNGLKAVRLAQGGIDAATEIFEADGYLKAFSGGETDRWPPEVIPGAPFALSEPGFEQKRYPCCYMLHRMIEGTLGLRRDTGVDLDAVDQVRVDMPAGGTKPLIHPFPRTGLNALFSGPYAVAASLADGRIDLASFTDEAVLRPALQARLADIRLVEAPGESSRGSEVGSAPVTVTLTLKDGSSVARTVTRAPGSPEDPMTEQQLAAKWTDCLRRVQPGLAGDAALSLFEDGLAIGASPDVGAWVTKLRLTLGASAA